jgi:hypothetical protein
VDAAVARPGRRRRRAREPDEEREEKAPSIHASHHRSLRPHHSGLRATLRR